MTIEEMVDKVRVRFDGVDGIKVTWSPTSEQNFYVE